MIKVTVAGTRKCLAVEVDPALWAQPPVVAGDLLRTAINDGLEQVGRVEAQQQAALLQGMMGELPGLLSKLRGGSGSGDLR